MALAPNVVTRGLIPPARRIPISRGAPEIGRQSPGLNEGATRRAQCRVAPLCIRGYVHFRGIKRLLGARAAGRWGVIVFMLQTIQEPGRDVSEASRGVLKTESGLV